MIEVEDIREMPRRGLIAVDLNVAAELQRTAIDYMTSTDPELEGNGETMQYVLTRLGLWREEENDAY